MNYISQNIRFLRKLAGLSQEQFAKKIQMNRGNIASYEKGSAEPSIEKLQRIITYFKVSLQDFIEKDLSKHINDTHFSNKTKNGTLRSEMSLNKTFIQGDPSDNFLEMEERLLNGHQEINRYKLKVQKEQNVNIQQINTSVTDLNVKVQQLIDMQQQILTEIQRP